MHHEHLYSVGLKHAVSWSSGKEPALSACWLKLPRLMIHVMCHYHMCANKLSPFVIV